MVHEKFLGHSHTLRTRRSVIFGEVATRLNLSVFCRDRSACISSGVLNWTELKDTCNLGGYAPIGPEKTVQAGLVLRRVGYSCGDNTTCTDINNVLHACSSTF